MSNELSNEEREAIFHAYQTRKFNAQIDEKYKGQGNYYPAINFITELFK